MNDNNGASFEVEKHSQTSERKYKKWDIVAFLLCLLAALSVWIYVMNTTQKEVERTITLTVNVSEQIYEASGMTIFSTLDDSFEGSEMDYSKLRVELTVTGMKNVLDKYSASDYSISVDTESIRTAEVQRLSFEYITPSPDIKVTSITTSLPVDSLYIDKPASATLTDIEAVLKNVMPTNVKVELFPKVDSIEISGPEKTISSITDAKIFVDLTVISSSTQVISGDIKLYGEQGEIKSAYVKVEPALIDVEAKISTERRFPIVFKQTTATDSEYKYTIALAGDVTEIVLIGDTAAMDFDNFIVDLGDITKIENLTGNISVSELPLPDGLSLGSGMAELTISYVITKEPVVLEVKPAGEDE